MKLAASNIAWPRDRDAEVAEVLIQHGVTGIEVAPTKLWPQSLAATESEIASSRAFWDVRGVAIVAAQALLFGKPELTLFDSAATRQSTLEHLSGIVRVCAKLGAASLVFGSPKNRRVGFLPKGEADGIAVEFFTRLGDIAIAAGTCIVLEANPPDYGADFITTAAEAIDLVERVNHPGFRLHLDTGCMTLAGDAIPGSFARGRSLLKHFHVSEPNLDPPGTSGRVDHAAFAAELRAMEYAGWVSIEIREPQPFSLETFTESIRTFAGWYEPVN